MSQPPENLIKQSILRHSRIDVCEPRSRTVSFSEESKQEDGDFILFPDHVMYPREKEFETKWKNLLLNRKSYTIIFGAAGCIYSASFRYFNGTISTMEKRFKISSRNIAVISSGNDISQVFASLFLTYYATGKNKPRWMSVSLYAMAFYCLLSALPHFLFGPGDDALKFAASTSEVESQKSKNLCLVNETISKECINEEGELVPQIILFVAQVIFGMAEAIFYVFGLSYLDDNVNKAKSPLMISVSYFIKMLGPAVGYTIASFSLSYYIDPFLDVSITPKHSQWLGCWWLGWIFIAIILTLFGYLVGLFPKKLTTEKAQENAENHTKNRELSLLTEDSSELMSLKKIEEKAEKIRKKAENERELSLKDFWVSLKRLLTNKTLMYNNLATVFYLFGSIPSWMFAPKYFETEFRQTSSQASFKIGTISFIFSGLGVLLSGIIITKFKPRARYLAAYNILTASLSVIGLVANNYMGCHKDLNPVPLSTLETCNNLCHCDFVKYSPICGSDHHNYISACHAGCSSQQIDQKLNIPIFTNCSCIKDQQNFAYEGPCPVDCTEPMIKFLIIIYLMKFFGASGICGNFLLSLRCVSTDDKPLSVGLMLMMTSLFAFIPAPIYFGVNIDNSCSVWGQSCSGNKENCWEYDEQKLRFVMNVLGAFFIAIGTVLDGGVWYYVKNLKLFDEENSNDEIEKDKN